MTASTGTCRGARESHLRAHGNQATHTSFYLESSLQLHPFPASQVFMQLPWDKLMDKAKLMKQMCNRKSRNEGGAVGGGGT